MTVVSTLIRNMPGLRYGNASFDSVQLKRRAGLVPGAEGLLLVQRVFRAHEERTLNITTRYLAL